MSHIDLPSIFKLLRNNDSHGIELLYTNYYKNIFAITFSILKNRESSEDVAHNIFVKLVNLDKEKFPTRGEKSWLFTLTKNEALNYLKKHQKSIALDELPKIPVLDYAIEDLFDMDSYNSLIANLNDSQQEVVTLKVLGGFSHKEIAEILQKPIGTIQWLYNTSIKKLKSTLAAMTMFTICTFSGLLLRIIALNKNTGDFGIATVPPKNNWHIVFQDQWVIVLLAVLCLALASTIIFFKNTDKLPTKHKR